MSDSYKMNLKLAHESLVVVPPPPSRFTLSEWHLNNSYRNRICLAQQKLADSIKAENNRVIGEAQERTDANRKETDFKLDERIEDIKFAKEEIEKQRKEACLEVDNLLSCIRRIQSCIDGINKDALQIVQKCIILREGRIGIDLCRDNVEIELEKELDVISGGKVLLNRAMEQANEQVRRLRSTMHIMDRDLENKYNVLKIDEHNAALKHTSLNLSIYYGFAPLDPANVTEKDWEEFTKENIEKTFKELASARQLRSYVDIVLKQIIDDLKSQYNAANNAFRTRIEELKESKTKTEVQHSEIVRQINEIRRSITELEKAVSEKEGSVALVHTRLGNRAQRTGMELCKDTVGNSLAKETVELRNDVILLQQKLAESYASLRYLLKTQIQLDEDINVKTNTIKIDEVDCMTLRQNIDYHYY